VADGPASLNQTVVNGVFEIGVYLDGAGTKISQTSICVNGADKNGNCESGSSSSAGTGIDAQNAPDLSLNQTNVDGYAAGFAASPCPNQANDLSINQSTVTNSTYPWSFQGGKVKTNHDSPTPPSGGSYAGSGVGSGASPVRLYVTNFLNNTITAYDQNGNQITTSGTFPNLNQPQGIAFDSSNGDLYVVNTGSSTVTEYDESGDQITPLGGFPNVNAANSITYDSSNGHLYVMNNPSGDGNLCESNCVTEYDQKWQSDHAFRELL